MNVAQGQNRLIAKGSTINASFKLWSWEELWIQFRCKMVWTMQISFNSRSVVCRPTVPTRFYLKSRSSKFKVKNHRKIELVSERWWINRWVQRQETGNFCQLRTGTLVIYIEDCYLHFIKRIIKRFHQKWLEVFKFSTQ
jgi:hypothetical protein